MKITIKVYERIAVNTMHELQLVLSVAQTGTIIIKGGEVYKVSVV